MKIEINPFITSGYAGPEYFCDRVQETQDIIDLLTNGNNLALISPRRLGKTDLLRHCFSQRQIQEHYYTFIIDIYSTNSLAEMADRMGKTILESLKPKGRRVWESFLNVMSSIKSSITFDSFGMPSWSVGIGDIHNPSATLDEIFRYLQQADKPCLVAIDEFQQILKYGDNQVEAAMRTHIQYCSNAHFVFSGSQRHLMGSIFTSPARPFYQSVTIINLYPIALDKYSEFCHKQFALGNKSLDDDLIEQIYNEFEGVTFYLQKVMNILYMRTPENGNCSTDELQPAIDYIIDFTAGIYQDLIYQLPEKQLIVLRAISQDCKANQIKSGAFVKKHALVSASSVNSAVRALMDKDLVTQDQGYYQVYDKFLAIWLNRQQ